MNIDNKVKKELLSKYGFVEKKGIWTNSDIEGPKMSKRLLKRMSLSDLRFILDKVLKNENR